MTVASTLTQRQYTGTGTSAQFSFPNKIFSAGDLVITIYDTSGNVYPFVNFANAVLGWTYSVQNVDVDTGCIVVLSNVLTSGWVLDIRSLIPELQSTSVKNQGQFLPELHEEAFDRATRMTQDLLRLTYTYGIHASDNESTSWPALPGIAARKGLALMFDAVTGLPTTGVPTTQTITQGLVYNLLYPSSGIGTGNTAAGYLALSQNGTGGTPGNNNTAFGYNALKALSGGVTNPTGSTAVGYLALGASNGATNTAVGDVCMASDLTGTDNTAVGAQALFSETNSTANNCFGFQCGYFITTGNSNSLFGNYAGGGINGPTGVGITTGTGNCGFGGATLANVTTAGGNSAFGFAALGNTTGGANVAIGNFAGNHATSSNEFYLDNQDRGTNANEMANAPIYGNFGAAAANNRLRFNAQLYASIGNLSSFNAAPTIASAATIAPTAMITFVSGAAAIATISVPFWMAGGSRITLIPTGVFTWTAASNIALAGTAVVGKALDFIYDSGTGKWYPAYIA